MVEKALKILIKPFDHRYLKILKDLEGPGRNLWFIRHMIVVCWFGFPGVYSLFHVFPSKQLPSLNHLTKGTWLCAWYSLLMGDD